MNTIQYSSEAVPYRQQVFPWAHQSRRRKRHLDRFSRYCRAHWVTDRLTDRQTMLLGR